MTEQLSEKDQQELLEKYDPEAGTRKLKGLTGVIAFAGLLAFSLFQLYTAIFGVFSGSNSKVGSFRVCARSDFFIVSGDKRFTEDRQIQSRLV